MKSLAVLPVVLVLACSPGETHAGESRATRTAGDGPLVVYTVNYPLAFFAQRIGGDAVRVEFPAPADGDPAFWSPDPETIVAYQDADLILLNGAGYAQWADLASLPTSRTIDTGASRAEHLIEVDDVSHTHGPGGEHEHRSTAFTTWLDPTFAIDQARAITAALSTARPQSRAKFEASFDVLSAELAELDERWRAIVGAQPEQPVLASHPVYQYLADRTGLSLESLHWEPDELPDDLQWRKLETLHASHPAKWMLWEGEPLPEVVERLRTIGVECVVFNPCGNDPGDGADFLGVMQANTAALETVFARN